MRKPIKQDYKLNINKNKHNYKELWDRLLLNLENNIKKLKKNYKWLRIKI
jgi:hypothetical protein